LKWAPVLSGIAHGDTFEVGWLYGGGVKTAIYSFIHCRGAMVAGFMGLIVVSILLLLQGGSRGCRC